MDCWVCNNTVEAYLPYGVPPRTGQCPHCGAKPRHRVLLWIFRRYLQSVLDQDCRVLEVGASRFAVERFPVEAFIGAASYTVADIQRLPYHDSLRAPHSFVQTSVDALGFEAGSFDIVLCNNVLPYVPDYLSALSEVRRCLKPDGLAFVETHREVERTLDAHQYRLNNPDLKEEFFRTNGDVWMFGDDFPDSVARAGLLPRPLHLFECEDRAFKAEHGLKLRSSVLAAVRSDLGDRRFLDEVTRDAARAPAG
jgi:SAM-dependent methyltransferase